MDSIQNTFKYISSHSEQYISAILRHLAIYALVLVIVVLIAVPLGYLCTKARKIAAPVQNITYFFRIIPSLALFFALLPIMGIGVGVAVTALVLSSIPTVLINSIAAFNTVDPLVIECAKAMGMKKTEIVREIEVPLSLPVMLGGIRIVTIEIIAGTTIAAYVGAGGLGSFIVSGLSQYRTEVLLTGAATVALISIIFDILLSIWQHRMVKKQTE